MTIVAPTPSAPGARPAPSGRAGRIGFLCLGLALMLLWLPPGPLPMLVLIADAPFLWLLFYRGGHHWKRWTFLYAFFHFALACRWLWEVVPIQVPATGLLLAPTYLLAGAAIRWCARRRAPMALAVGLIFVLEEMLRTIWLGGMPWPARSLAFASDAPLADGFGWLVISSVTDCSFLRMRFPLKISGTSASCVQQHRLPLQWASCLPTSTNSCR